MAAPRVAPAPGLLSTITGWPIAADSLVEMARARTSVVPPAGKGTTMVTCLVGQACADAAPAIAQRTATAAWRSVGWGMELSPRWVGRMTSEGRTVDSRNLNNATWIEARLSF